MESCEVSCELTAYVCISTSEVENILLHGANGIPEVFIQWKTKISLMGADEENQ